MLGDDEWAGDSSYGRLLGGRLRSIRVQKGLSLHDVEAGSADEFKASALGAYERGERAISVPRLERLARFYHVPVDQLLPAEEVAAREPAPRVESGRRAKVTIDLERARDFDHPEATTLNRYLEMIQIERQDFNGQMLTVRRDDLRALACIFHTTAELVPDVLDELGLIYSR
jgi:transcriptional regulator with XRE-family HTH domain